MEIIIVFSLETFFCLVNNSVLLNNIIKNLANNYKKIKLNKSHILIMLKQLILTCTPIINLIYSLYLDVNYMADTHEIYNYLEKKDLISNMSKWEKENKPHDMNGLKIIFNQLRYNYMKKHSQKIINNTEETIFYVDINNHIIELNKTIMKESKLVNISNSLKENDNIQENIQNDDKTLKLVRLKKKTKRRIAN